MAGTINVNPQTLDYSFHEEDEILEVWIFVSPGKIRTWDIFYHQIESFDPEFFNKVKAHEWCEVRETLATYVTVYYDSGKDEDYE